MEAIRELSDQIEACFRMIETTQMDGIPILNRELDVRCIGGREWGDERLFVLLTPWFMNLLLVPQDEPEVAPSVGSKRPVVFPAGRYEFICGFEPAIGQHWMCSLFSPVYEFGDQETALVCAENVLEMLFEEAEAPSEQDVGMSSIWRGEYPVTPNDERPEEEETGPSIERAEIGAEPAADFSRRGFLTGNLAQEAKDAS